MKIPKEEREWVRKVMRGEHHKAPRHIRLARLKRLKERIAKIKAHRERINRINAENPEGKLLK